MRQPAYSGLTEQEVLVLEMIVREGAQSPAEIAERTGLLPSYVDGVVERLAQLRYVDRKGGRYQGVARSRRP
jgi:DNA-binding MarR family transcriptional regulator